jgi:hypothetical protein
MGITEVGIIPAWRALGGAPLRGNRGRAFWRDGDGYSVALDTNGDRWFDHARGRGGGVLALVQTALGIDRRTAMAWLAHNCGIVAVAPAPTPEDRRRYAQRIGSARQVAEALVDRRDAYLFDLRTAATILLSEYHRRVAEAHETQDIELLASAEAIFEELEQLAARRERFQAAGGPELVRLFGEIERSATCALR